MLLVQMQMRRSSLAVILIVGFSALISVCLGQPVVNSGDRKKTLSPTMLPISPPTMQPTFSPTANPSCKPTVAPSFSEHPTPLPSISANPTPLPSFKPTTYPSSMPTRIPSPQPSVKPTFSPTIAPSTSYKPTASPTTASPTISQQQSDANALCAFKAGITNWPGSCAASITSGWSCNASLATSVACTSDESSWSGVDCFNNAILSLNLINCGFTGTISSQISKLNKIQEIHLSSSNFTSSIPEQISMLSALDSFYLDNNKLTGAAGSFLCTSALKSADPVTIPLKVQNNQFSCIADCVVQIAGSGYYDASTPVCSSPTYSPSVSPTKSLSPTASPTTSQYIQTSPNDDFSQSITIRGRQAYAFVIIVFVLLISSAVFFIRKLRLAYHVDDLNDINAISTFWLPLLQAIFYANWVNLMYTCGTNTEGGASIVNARLVIVSLFIFIRLLPLGFVLIITRYISDSDVEGSLFTRILANRGRNSRGNNQMLIKLVSLVMLINPGSVKLLPWRRSTFTNMTNGYPCYWLFKFTVKWNVWFTFASLILSISLLSLSSGDHFSLILGIINLILTIGNLFSMGMSDLYLLLLGKLSDTFEPFDDDDEYAKKKTFRESDLTIIELEEMKRPNRNTEEFKRPNRNTERAFDTLIDIRKSIAAFGSDEDVNIIDIIETYNVKMTENAFSIDEIEVNSIDIESVDMEKVDRKLFDSSVDVLSNQLKEAGLIPLQFIPLKDIRAEIATIIESMNANDKSKFDDQRLDYLIKCMNVNPDYIEEKKQESEKWRLEVMAKFEEWRYEMNKLIPATANKNSINDLVSLGLPMGLATRISTKKCLWLIKMDPDKIKKIHIADLRGKFSYQSQNLDIVELAAIYMSLPDKFENDSGNYKRNFRTELEDKLKLMYKEFGAGKLKHTLVRSPVYKGVVDSGLAFDTDDRLSFSLSMSEVSELSSHDSTSMSRSSSDLEFETTDSSSTRPVSVSEMASRFLSHSSSFSDRSRQNSTFKPPPNALDPALLSTINPMLIGGMNKRASSADNLRRDFDNA